MGHPVALTVRSKIASKSLTEELATLLTRISSGDLDSAFFGHLVNLVLKGASDVDIWKAVFDLIDQTRQTTPPSIPSAPQDTPITHSSASQQGSEQTRKQVESRILQEISSCTYRDVNNFFGKYFEGTHWTEQVNRTIKAAKVRHVNGRWAEYPNPPTQALVLEWLFGLQEDFFPDERGYYYTTHNRALSGSDAKRQLDIFVKPRLPELVEATHEWKAVRVIGELKQGKENNKALLLQLAAYARELFASQPTRRFIHGFTLCNTAMRLWVFDRSGPYSSTHFDIHDQPDRFVRTLVGYAMMSDTELGLDTFVERHDDDMFVTVKESGSEKNRRLQLDLEPIARQRAIVCRGTSCYRARDVGSEASKYVVKFSWRSDKRAPEGYLLRLAKDRGVEGVAQLVAYKDKIASIEDMRSGLSFGKPYRYRASANASSSFDSRSLSRLVLTRSASQAHGLGIKESSSSQKRKAAQDVERRLSKRSRSKSQQSVQAQISQSFGHDADSQCEAESTQKTSLLESNHDTFDNRILCCLVISPPGRSIREFHSIKQLLEAFRDAIKGHRSLYEKGNILHRDISENNIIITDGDYKGMLIDLDLAKERDKGPSGARHRTGTMEFMAIEVLDGVSHTYRHDLESFFYVFLWTCICYGWDFSGRAAGRPEPSLLRSWYRGSYEDIARVKQGDMHKQRFEKILAEFPPAFNYAKELARRVRQILFPIRGDAPFTGTLKDHDAMYQPIIQAFEVAVQECAEVKRS